MSTGDGRRGRREQSEVEKLRAENEALRQRLAELEPPEPEPLEGTVSMVIRTPGYTAPGGAWVSCSEPVTAEIDAATTLGAALESLGIDGDVYEGGAGPLDKSQPVGLIANPDLLQVR